MKWLKFILLLVALGIGAWLLLWLVGVIYSLLWYVFWIGLLGVGGTIGYKLFIGSGGEERPKLEEKHPIGLSEFQDADRALEEMKRKYLPLEKE